LSLEVFNVTKLIKMKINTAKTYLFNNFLRISINKRQHNIKVENTRLDNHRIPTKKDNAI
ncbi:hypothetical protein, partial [Staphylococcus warneri]|uniref:hypothetical protein n=1 Tax=Staphylococcus warneri TaxID=1292 RepID=UPI0027FE7B65